MNAEDKPHYFGHRKRIKDKFENFGLTVFGEYEILELALTFSIARKDVKPIAKELVKKFGGLKQVIDAKKEELESVKGISSHTSSFLLFLKQFVSAYLALNVKNGKSISSVSDIVDYLKSALGGEKVEKLYAVFLDSGNKVIDFQEIEKGTVNKSIIIPRKITELALKCSASALILAHNHPGGTLKPSQQDIDSTKSVCNSLKTVDIALLDHIIISGNAYFSFKECGLL